MTDFADDASAIEQLETETILRNHAQRPRVPQLCEACEEAPAHIDARGTQWRFCADCAEDHLRRNQAA